MNRTARLTAIAALFIATPVFAVVVNPFTETFDSTASNWSTAASPLTHPTYIATGGPDGSTFARTSFPLANSVSGDQPLVFRGQNNFNSSGGAFIGNWLGAGVEELNASIRHNGSAPITFYVRLAPFLAPNVVGPGVISIFSVPVQPNTWTTLSLAVDPSTSFIYEAGDFYSNFTNVARVQYGFFVNDSIAGSTTPLQVDIDNVGLVPAPGASALGLGTLALATRRRRR